jgi:hypothetical protein
MRKETDNLVEWVESVLNEEIIEAVAIGKPYSLDWDTPTPDYVGKLLSWEEARPILDYEFDSGYGTASCHPIYVWTPTRIICIHEYDGSTSLRILPRHPTPCIPEF